METRDIRVRGARVHNLKNVDLELPANRLICFTGVSGSGKSSMAFDTLYAEGQRRYVASLSAYARQFLGQMEKPARTITITRPGPPPISIEQKTTGHQSRARRWEPSPRFSDYLRVLWARVGIPSLRTECGKAVIGAQTRPTDRREELAAREQGKHAVHVLMAPILRQPQGASTGSCSPTLQPRRATCGCASTAASTSSMKPRSSRPLDKRRKHTVEAVIDRIVVKRGDIGGAPRPKSVDDRAASLGQGSCSSSHTDAGGAIGVLSSELRWPAAPAASPSPSSDAPDASRSTAPRACAVDCNGLGSQASIIDPRNSMIPDPTSLSIDDGAVEEPGARTCRQKTGWRLHGFTKGQILEQLRIRSSRQPLEQAVADARSTASCNVLWGTGR